MSSADDVTEEGRGLCVMGGASIREAWPARERISVTAHYLAEITGAIFKYDNSNPALDIKRWTSRGQAAQTRLQPAQMFGTLPKLITGKQQMSFTERFHKHRRPKSKEQHVFGRESDFQLTSRDGRHVNFNPGATRTTCTRQEIKIAPDNTWAYCYNTRSSEAADRCSPQNRLRESYEIWHTDWRRSQY